jgi:signal transduction histidine kinase
LSTTELKSGHIPDNSAKEKRKSSGPYSKKLPSRKRGPGGITAPTDGILIKANGTGLPLPDKEGISRPSDPVLTHNLTWKRQEEELVETKAEAEFYLDLMSHDIRNLTQIGVGYIELALESPDAGEIRSLMEKVQESLQETTDIVDNVRKLQEVRQRKTEKKAVNLSEVLSCLLSRYAISTSREIMINLKTVPGSIVWANDLVTDVFSNIINNAIKHSDPKKLLAVDIRMEHVKNPGTNCIKCTIDDNGPGISSWVKDKIFMRFQRGDTKAHGKGLGLHIARTLVEDYGGKIWVEDRMSGDYTKGARFVVVLPAA